MSNSFSTCGQSDAAWDELPPSHYRCRCRCPLQDSYRYVIPSPLRVNTIHNVRITHIEDGPYKFFLQLQVSADDVLPRLREFFLSHEYRQYTSQMIPGSSVVVKDANGKGADRRGVIVSMKAAACRVYCVDFGTTERVSYSTIAHMPQTAAELSPVLAIQFSLANVHDLKLSNANNEFFKRLLLGKQVTIRVREKEERSFPSQFCDIIWEGRDMRELLANLVSPFRRPLRCTPATTITAEIHPMKREFQLFVVSSDLSFVDASAHVEPDGITLVSKSPKFEMEICLPSNLRLLPETMGVIFVDRQLLKVTVLYKDVTPLCGNELHNYSPHFRCEDSIKFACEFCNERLSTSLKFSKILALPRWSDLPPVDCGGNKFCCPTPAPDETCNPGTSDFYYSFFFFQVHESCLKKSDDVKKARRSQDSTQVVCPKCGSSLGTRVNQSVQLLSSCVRLNGPVVWNLSGLDRFLESFKYFVRDLPFRKYKLLFVCKRLTRTSYTLAYLADRDLTLFTSSVPQGLRRCTLECKAAIKLCYSYYPRRTTQVDCWLRSDFAVIVPINPIIERSFLKYLDSHRCDVSQFYNQTKFRFAYIL